MKTRKTNLIYFLIITLLLISQILFPISSMATTGDNVSIKFEDKNLYEEIKLQLEDKVEASNDTTYTIQMSQEDINSIREIHIYHVVTNLKGIEYFKNIEKLVLTQERTQGEIKLTDITPLSTLTKLTYLSIGRAGANLINLDALKNLVHLRTLDLTNCEIKNIDALENLVSLEYLDIEDCGIKDISVLKTLTHLKVLKLDGNKIKNIDPLVGLTQMEELSLAWTGITDINPLATLINLKILRLNYNDFSDLTSLSNLIKLEKLCLGNNRLDNKELIPISNLTNLKELELDNNAIVNLDPFKNLVNLKRLGLYNNPTNNIDAIKYLSNLKYLDLTKNKLSNLDAIESSPITDIAVSSQILYQSVKIPNTTITTQEVDLPDIFIQAQNKNSKVYVKDCKFVLENCTLNKDNTKIIINNDKLMNKEKVSITIKGDGPVTGSKFTVANNGSYITVMTPPNKKEYLQNVENLDLTGGILSYYNVNKHRTEKIPMNSADVKVTGFDNTKLGESRVNVEYKNLETSFIVNVIEKSLQEIQMVTLPTKTDYVKGKENLDVTGGKVKLIYNDGSEEERDLTQEIVTGFDNSVVGKNTLIVTVDGKVTTFDVEIKEDTIINNTIISNILPKAGSSNLIVELMIVFSVITVFSYAMYRKTRLKK